ncbi:MAG: phosphodiesterase [Clostridiales bacterium]
MKLMIASDIHGSLFYANKMVELYKEEKCEKLILLGDILYHGPRNDLPKEYNPKGVIALLNPLKKEILCVRGNCEAEVDQMVLDFPVLADYMILFLDNRMVYVTHGHIHNEKNLPPLNKGDILLHGHTHLQAMEDKGDYIYINPGSVSIPKGNDVNSYMIYENGTYTIKDFNKNTIKEISISS